MGLQAVIIRCPNCNANLEVQSTVTSVSCSYCGTVSRIQAKTMMFQIPKSLPPAQSMTPQQRLEKLQQFQQLMPIRRVSIVLILLPFVILAVVVGGIFFAVKGKIGGAFGSNMMWAGHNPVLIDIDGDKVPDLVGLVRYVTSNDRAHLAAYSGKTGEQLWESESLGKYGDLGLLQFATAGSVIVIANDRGNVVGRDKVTGAVKWQVSLSEKIEAMCVGTAGELVIGTADDKWFALDAAGKKRDTKKLIRLDHDYTNDEARGAFEHVGGEAGDVCMPAGGNAWRQPPYVIALQRWHDLANIDGMNVDLLIKRPGGPSIALGHKQPGTQVPMVARLAPMPADGDDETPPSQQDPKRKTGKQRRADDKAALPGAKWVAEIPAVDLLVSRFDVDHATLSDKAVILLYEGAKSTYRLTSFDLESGKRNWDRQIHSGSGFVAVGLVITGDVVMLTTWQSLTAYAIADGTDRFSVGSN